MDNLLRVYIFSVKKIFQWRWQKIFH